MTRLSVIFAIIFIGIGAFGMWVYLTALKPLAPAVVCWEMPQSDLKGWKRVPEVDRQTIAFRKSSGKVLMRHEASLMCREYAERTTPLTFIATEWWWKEKR